MQQHREDLNSSPTSRIVSGNGRSIRDGKVRDLVADKRRLVEVPYTATLSHAMNVLVANDVVAVPVAAPYGHWIGAGGSAIIESDKQTGVARKHYIGIVSMLDILAHIAADDHGNDFLHGESEVEKKMSVPVSSIIGNCPEGLSLWSLNPNSSLVDCTELFSKGIHRALVPTDGQTESTVGGAKLVETASSYHMLTQMDLMKFIKAHAHEMAGTLSCTVAEVGAVNEDVYAITNQTRVGDAVRCMKEAMLSAVPITAAPENHAGGDDPSRLINGKGRKLTGTFSATDLRGHHLSALRTLLALTALEFTEAVSSSPSFSPRELVTCRRDSPLGEVVDKAVLRHVHRVWVVDADGLLVGLVSLTDVIRALRQFLIGAEPSRSPAGE